MSVFNAVIKFCPVKNCFISFPKNLVRKFHRDKFVAVKIESSTGKLCASWSGDCSGDGGSVYNTSSENIVEINGVLAAKHGFKNDQEVSISIIDSIPECNMVQVEPASVDDWEILEMNASEIESSLLDQVRLVALDQILPIWVSNSTCIFVKIGELEPRNDICLLMPNTQVVVSPKVRNKFVPTNSINQPSRKQLNDSSDDDSNQTSLKERFITPGSESPTTSQISAHDSDPKLGAFGGLISRLKSNIRAVWYGEGVQVEHTENLDVKPKVQHRDSILSFPFKFACRVLSFESHSGFENLNASCEKSIEIMAALKQKSPDINLRQPSNVYISSKTIFDSLPSDHGTNSFLALLSKQKGPLEKAEESKSKSRSQIYSKMKTSRPSIDESKEQGATDAADRQFVVRVVIISDDWINEVSSSADVQKDDSLMPSTQQIFSVPANSVLIPDSLRKILKLSVTSRVLLESLDKTQATTISELQCCPLFKIPSGFTDDMLELSLRVHLRSICSSHGASLVMNEGMIVNCFVREGFFGDFIIGFASQSDNKNSKHGFLYPDMVDEIRIKILPSMNNVNIPSALEISAIDQCVQLTSLNDVHISQTLSDDLFEFANFCLNQRQHDAKLLGLKNGGLLLCGQKGVGKTTQLQILAKRMSEFPNYVFIQVIDCKHLKGKKPETIRQHLQSLFDELSWRQPSLLILEDLDHIAASPGGVEQEMSGLAIYHSKVAEILKDIVKQESANNSRICLVASSQSTGSLHSSLTQARGRHLFTRILELKPPDRDDRMKILQKMLSARKNVVFDEITCNEFKEVDSKMEGYTTKDLEMIVNRTIHLYLMGVEGRSDSVALNSSHFDAALADYVPASLRSASLVRPDELGWTDVGGLNEVRKTLIQTLEWPTKYPKLFALSPLRLRSGLLLYGAPGTGKTLLAAVVAKEFNLNFISIKGPELLNKYIGASEQAVRDTFARAENARPCILFFDEFDSLAPRRGHDSTGVTDRVVNQLLTQLNGVEKLEGVFVLAATSRPDLIDPALLRPGRLDKIIHCPIPSKDERLEILTALSRKMNLAAEVDLRAIAESCENFTGADFKALLYNAQLEAIHQWEVSVKESHDLLGKGNGLEAVEGGDVESNVPDDDYDGSEESSSPCIFRVSEEHLWKAAKDMTASVHPAERLRYQQIYAGFVGSRVVVSKDSVYNVGNRATLA